MNYILFRLINDCIYNSFDDILIYSRTINDHYQHIRKVLEIFNKYKLKINFEKCRFIQIMVKFQYTK